MKKILVAFCLVFSLVFMAAVCASAAPARDARITMVTGGTGNLWFIGGAMMADSWNANVPGVYITTTDGGAESNVRIVADGTDAQLGMTWAPFYYNSLKTEGMFEDMTEAPKIKAIMNFIVAVGPVFVASEQSGIKKFEDIAGKRFLAGYTGSGVEYTSRLILDAYGTSYDALRAAGTNIVFADFPEGPTLMKDGHLDVFTVVTGAGRSSIIASVEAEMDVRLLQFDQKILDKLTKDYPGFITYTIPAGTYKGQDKDIKSLAYNVILFAHESVADDVIYDLVKDVFERSYDDLRALDPNFSVIDASDPWAAIGWDEVHPGAQKYYLEKGVGPK